MIRWCGWHVCLCEREEGRVGGCSVVGLGVCSRVCFGVVLLIRLAHIRSESTTRTRPMGSISTASSDIQQWTHIHSALSARNTTESTKQQHQQQRTTLQMNIVDWERTQLENERVYDDVAIIITTAFVIVVVVVVFFSSFILMLILKIFLSFIVSKCYGVS